MDSIYSRLLEQGAEWLMKAAPCPPAQLRAIWLNEGPDFENTAILDDACRKAMNEYVSRIKRILSWSQQHCYKYSPSGHNPYTL